MRDEHLLLVIVCPLLCSHPSCLHPPLKRPGCWTGRLTAAQTGIVQQVPHQPDLGNTETVNNHEFSVETGIKCLKVGRRRGPGDSKSAKALVSCWFYTNNLKAHPQKDIVNREQLHLRQKIYTVR